MDLLRTAVVDITTLVATCHALRAPMAADALGVQRKQRDRLRRDVKRGTLAYIDVLARSRRSGADESLLVECRLAAELQMPQALARHDLLRRMLAHQAGALDGLAAARQDLWRLAHVAVHLRLGLETLRASAAPVDAKAVDHAARHLRRRLRKALIAYARAALRIQVPKGRLIIMARAAALHEIGRRGTAAAERLADFEAGLDPAGGVIARGVTQRLLDLALDWHRREVEPG